MTSHLCPHQGTGIFQGSAGFSGCGLEVTFGSALQREYTHCEGRNQDSRDNSASKERLQLGNKLILSFDIHLMALFFDPVASKKHLSFIESCTILSLSSADQVPSPGDKDEQDATSAPRAHRVQGGDIHYSFTNTLRFICDPSWVCCPCAGSDNLPFFLGSKA